MKTNIKQIAAAIIVAIFTAVSIFSMAAKSDTISSKTFSIHVSDSTEGNGDDTTDGSGGAGYPPKD